MQINLVILSLLCFFCTADDLCFLFADRLLNGNAGKPVVYLLFMLAATLVMYLVINYNYKTTYDETYQESANLRIDLAEQLSKLPYPIFKAQFV